MADRFTAKQGQYLAGKSYKVLSGERSPGFDTILKVLGTPGIKLHA